jgi:ABC-type transport system involved in cytochrome bd biosynthesis fused ATPase/permease subunit
MPARETRSHRISSAERASRVLLLDGAGVVLGTHADLPDRSPLYAELVGYWQPGVPARQMLSAGSLA